MTLSNVLYIGEDEVYPTWAPLHLTSGHVKFGSSSSQPDPVIIVKHVKHLDLNPTRPFDLFLYLGRVVLGRDLDPTRLTCFKI